MANTLQRVPIGLLAPLGYMHLASAVDRSMRSLAIGSRAPEVLEQFDKLAGSDAPVLLHESLLPPPVRAEAAFSGTWGGWASADGNGIPPRAWKRFRSSLMEEEDRIAGYFTSFFLVQELTRMESPRLFTDLRTWGSDKPLSPAFLPHGPVIVHW